MSKSPKCVRGGGFAKSLLAPFLAVFVLMVFVLAASGSTQACFLDALSGAHESAPAWVSDYKITVDVEMAHPSEASLRSNGDMPCAGDGMHHLGGACCASDSCSGYSAALPGELVMAIEADAGRYVVSSSARLVFANPESQFRPPRLSA